MTSDSCVSCIAQGSYFITDVVNFFAHIVSVFCQFFEVSFVGFSFNCRFIGINFFTIVFYSLCSKLQALRQVNDALFIGINIFTVGFQSLSCFQTCLCQVNDVFIVASDGCASCIAQGSYFVTDVVNIFAHVGSVFCQFFEVSFIGFSFDGCFIGINVLAVNF